MEEQNAVEALVDLGLSTYEARVFIALVKLGSGTARDVAEISDVPRSQVYTTAKDLDSRGIISIQQSSPQVFQPVSLSEVESQLEQRFEAKRETAFTRLEELEKEAGGPSEQSEDVWSITGEAAIVGRMIKLIQAAEESIIYAAADLTNPQLEFLGELQACCERDVGVHLLREPEQEIPELWTEIQCVTVHPLPPETQHNDYAVRMLIVDSDVFLLSIRGRETESEIAIWSAHTTFAEVFSQLLTASLPKFP